jgi:hypothetical protein
MILRKIGLRADPVESEFSDDSLSSDDGSDAGDFEAGEDEREYFRALPKWQKMKYKKDNEVKVAKRIVKQYERETRRERTDAEDLYEDQKLYSKALAVCNIDLAVEMLVEGRVDVNFEDAMGRTVLNVIASMGAASLDHKKFIRGFKGVKNNEMVKRLTQYGADFNHENALGTFPMHFPSFKLKNAIRSSSFIRSVITLPFLSLFPLPHHPPSTMHAQA